MLCNSGTFSWIVLSFFLPFFHFSSSFLPFFLLSSSFFPFFPSFSFFPFLSVPFYSFLSSFSVPFFLNSLVGCWTSTSLSYEFPPLNPLPFPSVFFSLFFWAVFSALQLFYFLCVGSYIFFNVRAVELFSGLSSLPPSPSFHFSFKK